MIETREQDISGPRSRGRTTRPFARAGPIAVAALFATGCDGSLLSINPNAPPTPGGLTADVGDEEVFLSWNDVVYSTTQGHGFNIFQGTSPESLERVAGPFGSTVLDYVARGLANGTTYYFAVSAESFGAESALSAVVSAAPEPQFLVEGMDLGAPGQVVRVSRRTIGIEDAEVRVSGTELLHLGGGAYGGNLPEDPIPGLTVTLAVTVDGGIITGSGVAPPAAIVTGPEQGSTYSLAELVPVAWETPEDPDGFRIHVCWDDCAASVSFGLGDGTSRSFQFSPLGLPVDLFTDYTIEVVPHNDGAFTGSVAPGSRMDLRASPSGAATRSVRLVP
jgi:hypothetical protein